MTEYAFNENTVESKRILYTPSSFAKEDLLHLQETGTLKALKSHASKRSHLKSYLFFIILHGHGKLIYEGASHELSMGDCVFIDCSKAYIHETSGDLWTLQWVHFYGTSMAGIYEKYCNRGGLPIFHPSETSGFTEVLEKLYTIATSDDYLKDMRINEILSSLLTLIMENSWFPENQRFNNYSSSANIIEDLKKYIDNHYKEKLILDELSEKFFINKYHMIRLFKSRYGLTIINYQTNLRIGASKQLLRFSDLSMEDISLQCGFDDPNYFSRTFKSVEGSSPSSYRRMWRDK